MKDLILEEKTSQERLKELKEKEQSTKEKIRLNQERIIKAKSRGDKMAIAKLMLRTEIAKLDLKSYIIKEKLLKLQNA